MNDDGDSVATEDMPDKVAILGRPFRLGNFYDARTGNLIVGQFVMATVSLSL